MTTADGDPFAAALGALVGEEQASRMLADVKVPDVPASSGVDALDELCPGAAAAALVAPMGLSLDHDEVVAEAREVLAGRGHDAEVVSVRWGVLTVSCAPVAGQLLSYDRDALLGELARRGVTQVTKVRVRVQNPPRD